MWSQPVLSTLVVVVSDLFSILKLSFRSRTALLAENLFLRKQLAFYEEHKIRPRLLTDATRLTLVLWSRWFNWKDALIIVKPGDLDWLASEGIPSVRALEVKAGKTSIAEEHPRAYCAHGAREPDVGPGTSGGRALA